MNSKEAAAYCGLSVVSFRAFAKRNGIKRIGGAYVYDLQAIDRAIDGAIYTKITNQGDAFEVAMSKVNRNAIQSRKRKQSSQAH